VGAWQGGRLEAVLLDFSPPGFTSFCTAGDRQGVGAILRSDARLPTTGTAMVRHDDLEHIRARYTIDPIAMLRMVVTAEALGSGPVADLPIRQLGSDDAAALQALYVHWAGAGFSDFALEHGVYFGAVDDERLVAVSATHAVNVVNRIATVGGVFTHPDYRGRGLAGATTIAVCREVARRGVVDIALNVIEGNTPAIRAYTRIGFRVHGSFVEGHATLRG
jgi:GNAT superfamily N-acetyltransferase